jgi:preprotein translocase subunit YajC
MLTLAFAQEAVQAPGVQQNPLMGLAPVALIFVVFYFLLIRPQKKQQQEHGKMLAELKKNDEVVTSGGIYGTIVNLQDDVVVLRVDENARIKVQKSAVARVKKKAE